MKQRQPTMLEKSIKMNLDLSAKYAASAIGWVLFAFFGLDLLTIPALVAVVIYIFLTLRQLFDQSLFSGEAYAYIMVPISMRCMIIGKVIVLCFWLMLGFLTAFLSMGIAALLFDASYLDWSVGALLLQDASGVFDAAENGLIGKEEILYDRGGLLHLAANIILAPFTVLADGIFVCGLFQMGYAVRHVLAPGRDRPVVTVMIAFAGVAVFCLVLAALISMDFLISGDTATIWSVLLEAFLLGGGGAGLLVVGIRLLERKYCLS